MGSENQTDNDNCKAWCKLVWNTEHILRNEWWVWESLYTVWLWLGDSGEFRCVWSVSQWTWTWQSLGFLGAVDHGSHVCRQYCVLGIVIEPPCVWWVLGYPVSALMTFNPGRYKIVNVNLVKNRAQHDWHEFNFLAVWYTQSFYGPWRWRMGELLLWTSNCTLPRLLVADDIIAFYWGQLPGEEGH